MYYCSTCEGLLAHFPCWEYNADSVSFQSAQRMGVDVLSIDGFECMSPHFAHLRLAKCYYRCWPSWRRRYRRCGAGEWCISFCLFTIWSLSFPKARACGSRTQRPIYCIRRFRRWTWSSWRSSSRICSTSMFSSISTWQSLILFY